MRAPRTAESGPAEADRDTRAAEERRHARLRRRGVLGALAAAALGGAAGTALGYRFRTELRTLKLAVLARPLALPDAAGAFRRDAAAIWARHQAQSADDVAALKARYEAPVYGRVRVWDLVEKLALCVDPTDLRLFCGSQFVHLQQILAAMEQNGVTDPDMLLLAIVHDLGKVLLLTGEAPENVVCGTRLVAGGEDGAGLARSVFQFGHGEFVYSRIKDHVPEHVAWVARYHNVNPDRVRHLMDARDREYSERYLEPFRRFDGGFVSPYYLPKLDLARYRALVEGYFPVPILV